MKLFSPSAVWKNYRQGKKIRNIIDECPGWCRVDKALAFEQIIRERNIKLSVEIGVYGGRSLLPQALAHKEYTGGMVIGIDPWNAHDAMQYGEGAAKEIFIRTNERFKDFDFESLFQSVNRQIEKYGVQGHCKLIRKRSSDAVADIPDGIEFLHIDGNHGDDAVMQDVTLYLPKVKQGGLIWFDDVKWDSVSHATEYARSRCKLYRKFDDNNLILEKL